MDLSIVIPFYNEEDNAEDTIKGIDAALKDINIKYEIVAVDNGSTDRTGAVLNGLKGKNANLKIVTVPFNEGYGWGIRQGLKESSGEYVGFMCGDNQIDPHELAMVYNKAVAEKLDLCKVRRVERHDGVARSIISFFFNSICPALFSIKGKDLNGTPKIFRKNVFEKLGLTSKGWFIDAEIMIKCSRMRCRMGDVPAVFRKREKGSSKINYRAVFSFVREMVSYKYKGI